LLNNTNTDDILYGAVIMQGHCESSPGSFHECWLIARWLPTLKPSQRTCPVVQW